MAFLRGVYGRILICAIALTTILFSYDYIHDGGNKQAMSRTLMETATYGLLYVVAIFLVASLLYFCFNKVVTFISK